MITTAEAIDIARKAAKGKAELDAHGPLTVNTINGRYVVTFVHVNPPGVRGADFDAKVTIDAHSGQVLEILGGS